MNFFFFKITLEINGYERERERERENLEVSRNCEAKLWIISSYFEPNNSFDPTTKKKNYIYIYI